MNKRGAMLVAVAVGLAATLGLLWLSVAPTTSVATDALASANAIIEVQRRIIALHEDLAKVATTCVTFEALAPGQESIWARIGELQLCGRNLEWSMARGPSYSAVIANRDAEIAALRTRIDELTKEKP